MTQRIEHLIASNTCFDLKQVITLKTTAGEVVVKPSASCQVAVVALRQKEKKCACSYFRTKQIYVDGEQEGKEGRFIFALTQQINHSVCRF